MIIYLKYYIQTFPKVIDVGGPKREQETQQGESICHIHIIYTNLLFI